MTLVTIILLYLKTALARESSFISQILSVPSNKCNGINKCWGWMRGCLSATRTRFWKGHFDLGPSSLRKMPVCDDAYYNSILIVRNALFPEILAVGTFDQSSCNRF